MTAILQRVKGRRLEHDASTAYATCIRARELGTPDDVLKRFVISLEIEPDERQSIIDRLNLRSA